MPAWKVYDEETAAELKSRLPENSAVSVETRAALLDGENTVILVPTAHKGVTMLITARRKPASTLEQRPIIHDELPSLAESSSQSTTAVSPDADVEDFFGPTTWERIEHSELEAVPFEPIETVTQDKEPETVFENSSPRVETPAPVSTPVYEPEQLEPEPIVEVSAQPVPPKNVRERHYIATGFLGLEESVEDDEDIAREKRPWWKKLFID
jgi:hypothetical protein